MGKLSKITKTWRRLPNKTQQRIKGKAKRLFSRNKNKK